MNRVLATAIAVAAVGVSTFATASDADARRRYRDRWAPAVATGLVIGYAPYRRAYYRDYGYSRADYGYSRRYVRGYRNYGYRRDCD